MSGILAIIPPGFLDGHHISPPDARVLHVETSQSHPNFCIRCIGGFRTISLGLRLSVFSAVSWLGLDVILVAAVVVVVQGLFGKVVVEDVVVGVRTGWVRACMEPEGVACGFGIKINKGLCGVDGAWVLFSFRCRFEADRILGKLWLFLAGEGCHAGPVFIHELVRLDCSGLLRSLEEPAWWDKIRLV